MGRNPDLNDPRNVQRDRERQARLRDHQDHVDDDEAWHPRQGLDREPDPISTGSSHRNAPLYTVQIVVEYPQDDPQPLSPRALPIVPRVDDVLVIATDRYRVSGIEIDVDGSTITAFVEEV